MSDTKRIPRRAMGQFSADEGRSDIAPTIVGGQPAGRKTVSVKVPVGIERVLYLAATDAIFKRRLLRDRDQAARARGFALRDSEVAMLRRAPEPQLRATIETLDVSQENVGRRGFMKAVALSAVTIAAGKALAGCGDDETAKVDIPGQYLDAGAGVRVDMPVVGVDAGSRPPDLPLDAPGQSVDAGVRVDLPPVIADVGQSDASIASTDRGVIDARPIAEAGSSDSTSGQ